MRTVLLLATMLASPVFASQVVWKWVDSQGVTHYSDRPVPGAERIEVRSGSSNTTPPSAPPSASASTTPTRQKVQEAPAYRLLEVWKPGNEEVLFNVGGNVEVNIRVEPELQPGHRLNLYLDGRLVEGFPDNTTQYSLTEIYRGTHRLVAAITDEAGRRVMESAPVMFHVRQTSTINPTTGRPINAPAR
jgi:hypothetical protein